MTQTAIDPRVIKLSLEFDGTFTVFSDLEITARGRKTANPQENTCEVKVSNLTKEHRDYLLGATSPFLSNRKNPKRMMVEAGRASTGLTRLFYGDITMSQVSQPPDIGLTLKFQTAAHHKGVIVARAGMSVQQLSGLSANVAKDLGLDLTFQATDRSVANYSHSGANLGQVQRLADTGGVDAFVDDTTLVVKNRGAALTGRSVLLSKDTGMIGVPEFTERGLKVQGLVDTGMRLGGAVQIQSQLNPAANGTYTVYALEFDIANRDTPWYLTAECFAPGQIFKPIGRKAKSS